LAAISAASWMGRSLLSLRFVDRQNLLKWAQYVTTVECPLDFAVSSTTAGLSHV
jgi:hypothetical protein